MLWAPYDKPEDDRLAQACQVQIFFALLADIILSYDEDPVQANSRIDWLLSGTTMGLLGLSIYQNTGVADWLGSSLAVAFTWFGTKRKKTGQEGQEEGGQEAGNVPNLCYSRTRGGRGRAASIISLALSLPSPFFRRNEHPFIMPRCS